MFWWYVDNVKTIRIQTLFQLTSIQDPTAKIGERCRIGPNVVIGPRVVIQDGVSLKNCTVLADSFIKSHTWICNSIIGWRCHVGRWVNIETNQTLTLKKKYSY